MHKRSGGNGGRLPKPGGLVFVRVRMCLCTLSRTHLRPVSADVGRCRPADTRHRPARFGGPWRAWRYHRGGRARRSVTSQHRADSEPTPSARTGGIRSADRRAPAAASAGNRTKKNPAGAGLVGLMSILDLLRFDDPRGGRVTPPRTTQRDDIGRNAIVAVAMITGCVFNNTLRGERDRTKESVLDVGR